MGGKSFLNITLDPETIKQKREIFNYIKIKHSCVAKTTVNQTKDTYHRRTIFSLIYKALLSNTKKMTNNINRKQGTVWSAQGQCPLGLVGL